MVCRTFNQKWSVKCQKHVFSCLNNVFHVQPCFLPYVMSLSFLFSLYHSLMVLHQLSWYNFTTHQLTFILLLNSTPFLPFSFFLSPPRHFTFLYMFLHFICETTTICNDTICRTRFTTTSSWIFLIPLFFSHPRTFVHLLRYCGTACPPWFLFPDFTFYAIQMVIIHLDRQPILR